MCIEIGSASLKKSIVDAFGNSMKGMQVADSPRLMLYPQHGTGYIQFAPTPDADESNVPAAAAPGFSRVLAGTYYEGVLKKIFPQTGTGGGRGSMGLHG